MVSMRNIAAWLMLWLSATALMTGCAESRIGWAVRDRADTLFPTRASSERRVQRNCVNRTRTGLSPVFEEVCSLYVGAVPEKEQHIEVWLIGMMEERRRMPIAENRMVLEEMYLALKSDESVTLHRLPTQYVEDYIDSRMWDRRAGYESWFPTAGPGEVRLSRRGATWLVSVHGHPSLISINDLEYNAKTAKVGLVNSSEDSVIHSQKSD